MDLLKLLALLAVIVLALRRKIPVGVALFGAGLLTAILYLVPVVTVWEATYSMVRSHRFIMLTSVVILITILGALLKELGFLDRLTASCQRLPGGKRTAAAALPAFVGLMPMPAGSLLSAPLVNNVLDSDNYQPEFRTAVNYWYRHWVELFWPLYPGLILTEAITGMPIGTVSLMQLPLALGMFLIGAAIFLRKIEKGSRSDHSLVAVLLGIFRGIWPILLAIAIYAILKIDLALAILIVICVLTVVIRPERKVLLRTVKHGLSFNLVVLIFGVLFFQAILEVSGAIEAVTRLAVSGGMPPEIVIFAVCFLVGLLTGVVAAFVGLGYSLLAGLLYQPVLDPGHIMLAYISGYLGVMLSPSHLCLILTTAYFKAELGQVYRTIAPPFVLWALFGIALYCSSWVDLFK